METATPSPPQIIESSRDLLAEKAARDLLDQRSRELLNEKAAADFLDLKPGTLSVWRSRGRYRIPFVKVGHLVRYRRSDLEAWLVSRTRSNGATV